jgi:hypothetical protein
MRAPLQWEHTDDQANLTAAAAHMAFRNMSPNTQKIYSYAVARFAKFHHRSPDKLGLEHIREYRLHLMSRGVSTFVPERWRLPTPLAGT